MATLELRKTSNWWYGRWTEGGRVIVRNLDVRVEGVRPADGSESGDRKFRASREAAEDKLRELAREATTRKHEVGLVQAVHVARTGRRVDAVPISGMMEAWRALPRRKEELSATHLGATESTLKRFAGFLEKRYPSVKEMAEVTPTMAQAFMAAERGRGVAGRTYNAALILLKGCFRNLRRQAGIVDNPFDGLIGMAENTVHRVPFTEEELARILKASEGDAFSRPLIVTGICTAMRRGDVCRLRWADVDLERRFLAVSTSKTGARVSIPMFDLLYRELKERPREGAFCFPEQAAMYAERPYALGWRLEQVFKAAGVGPDGMVPEDVEPLGPESLRLGRDKLEGCTEFTEKVRRNLVRVYDLYVSGRTLKEVAKELGLSMGGASMYLKRIEKIVGFSVVRGHGREKRKAEDPTLARRGLRRVCLRGFHAFRSTWVTLALSAGVPMELVRRVTGHTTTQIVLDHYFQPGREEFRAALMGAMPAVLTGEGEAFTTKDAKDTKGESEVVVLAGKVAAGSATEAEKARLGKLLAG